MLLMLKHSETVLLWGAAKYAEVVELVDTLS
jgi:hypothetical protein